MLATPFRLMLRPFAGYRALAAEKEPPSLVIGAGRFLLALGALVAVSATGRFAPLEAFLAMVSFSWLPIVHTIAIAATVRVFRPATPWRRALALYFEGIGPWLLLFLILIGRILVGSHPERPAVMYSPGGFPLLVVAAVWSIGLSYALFNAGLGMSRLRAGLATLFFWLTCHVLILGYFLAVGQLWPIL